MLKTLHFSQPYHLHFEPIMCQTYHYYKVGGYSASIQSVKISLFLLRSMMSLTNSPQFSCFLFLFLSLLFPSFFFFVLQTHEFWLYEYMLSRTERRPCCRYILLLPCTYSDEQFVTDLWKWNAIIKNVVALKVTSLRLWEEDTWWHIWFLESDATSSGDRHQSSDPELDSDQEKISSWS